MSSSGTSKPTKRSRKRAKKPKYVDIQDAITAARIQKARGSMLADELRSQRAAFMAEIVKSSSCGDKMAEASMRLMYYQMLNEYYQRSGFAPPPMNKKSSSFWARVVARQVEAQVPIDVFLTAQFKWFDKHFGSPPPLPSLVTENAVLRATSGSNTPKQVAKDASSVVSSGVPFKSEMADLLREADKSVQSICKAQEMTREEFYRNLVVTGFFALPKAYLDRDPVYQKLKNEMKP